MFDEDEGPVPFRGGPRRADDCVALLLLDLNGFDVLNIGIL